MNSVVAVISFDEFIKAVFGGAALDAAIMRSDPSLYFQAEPAVLVAYLTKLFKNPHAALSGYTDKQLEDGFWLINNDFGLLRVLFDRSVEREARLECIRAIYTLFEKFFDPIFQKCEAEGTAKPSYDEFCYMWWDIFPSWGHPDAPGCAALDDTILEVMAKILKLKSQSCQLSALHGLGHWYSSYPTRTAVIIEDFLVNNPAYPNKAYAYEAKAGLVL